MQGARLGPAQATSTQRTLQLPGSIQPVLPQRRQGVRHCHSRHGGVVQAAEALRSFRAAAAEQVRRHVGRHGQRHRPGRSSGEVSRSGCWSAPCCGASHGCCCGALRGDCWRGVCQASSAAACTWSGAPAAQASRTPRQRAGQHLRRCGTALQIARPTGGTQHLCCIPQQGNASRVPFDSLRGPVRPTHTRRWCPDLHRAAASCTAFDCRFGAASMAVMAQAAPKKSGARLALTLRGPSGVSYCRRYWPLPCLSRLRSFHCVLWPQSAFRRLLNAGSHQLVHQVCGMTHARANSDTATKTRAKGWRWPVSPLMPRTGAPRRHVRALRWRPRRRPT